jgi:hypothetical protein
MAIAATLSLLYSVTYGVLAYLIPGYLTFKAVESKATEPSREWGMYWVVLAAFSCLSWFIDLLLCWLPFYYPAKLFFLYTLWAPSFKLAQTVYIKVVSPLLASYEADIDKAMAEGRVKLGDLVGHHSQSLKVAARDWSGKASVALKNVQQKALEKAKAAGASRKGFAGADGVHTD